MKNAQVLISTEERTIMAKAEYVKSSEFAIIFKSATVITGTYKKGKLEGMTAPVAGIFTAADGKIFLVYSDTSANAIENTDAKGYKL